MSGRRAANIALATRYYEALAAGDFDGDGRDDLAVGHPGEGVLGQYDGAVTISDLGHLASNWQAGVGNPLGMSFQEALVALSWRTSDTVFWASG